MITIKTLSLLALICSLTATASYGALTTFDFSYTFPDDSQGMAGMVVMGSLQGTLSSDGQFVENITDVNVHLWGNSDYATTFVSPIQAFLAYTDVGNPPVVSFDLSKCDFEFQSEIWPDQFFIIGGQDSGRNQRATLLEYVHYPTYVDGDYFALNLSDLNQAQWSLTEAPVPEPTSLISGLLLILPLASPTVRMLWKKA